MERLEEIRKRLKKVVEAKGQEFLQAKNNLEAYALVDIEYLLSLIYQYELQAELFEQFKTERKEMIELMVSKGFISPDQYLEVVNQVLYRKGE